MIAFNHNILFSDEPGIDTGDWCERCRTIPVLQEKTPSSFAFYSEWAEMSGRRMRYGSDGAFADADDGFCWGMEIEAVVSLRWDAASETVYYHSFQKFTPELLRFWVLHTFLPIMLELRRLFRILHVGAVEIKEKAVLFSAFSFGGKSTLTDYFLQKGHRLLSDDSLGVQRRDGRYIAVSSYPFHRPYRELETLGYPVKNFLTTPAEIHAVYVLERSAPDANVLMRELEGVDKFKAFHYSTFIDFEFMKRERLEYFGEMAKRISVYNVTVPWDLSRLPEVYEAITKQVASK